jgi:hypothetical protein
MLDMATFVARMVCAFVVVMSVLAALFFLGELWDEFRRPVCPMCGQRHRLPAPRDWHEGPGPELERVP